MLVLVFACDNSENSFMLNGFTVLDDGEVIYRIVPNSVNQPVRMDSTIVRNGTFNFSSDVKEIDVNFS